jgi:hypothetical protein
MIDYRGQNTQTPIFTRLQGDIQCSGHPTKQVRSSSLTPSTRIGAGVQRITTLLLWHRFITSKVQSWAAAWAMVHVSKLAWMASRQRECKMLCFATVLSIVFSSMSSNVLSASQQVLE